MEGANRRAAPSGPINELVREAAAISVALSDSAITRFQIYIDTLLLWRKRLSLTTAASAEEIVRSHILDSLTLCRFVLPGMRVADLGSGAGFPGIPLAIAGDQARVSLVESRRRKANFLREVVRSAELANAEVIEERAERLADHVTEPWDVVVSRAVWRLSDFLKVSEHLLARGGVAVAMKGPRASTERPLYRGALVPSDVVEYRLQSGAHRQLIVYRKP